MINKEGIVAIEPKTVKFSANHRTIRSVDFVGRQRSKNYTYYITTHCKTTL
jgi:hypothetical protein